MDHKDELKALTERRFGSHAEAKAAIPSWLTATFHPNSTDVMMREERFTCKPAILYQAGWIIYGYTIRTRSEEVRRDVWRDHTEVYVSRDYVFSYTFKDGIRDALDKGQIALAPQAQEEMNALETA